jgi:hypothetical protein
MPQIIYEQTSGALVPQAERTLSTFESGLVRVDRKYICRSSVAATHRSTLAVGNTLPYDEDGVTLDGLYIYPTPQETKRGDGFTEFSVSAYGRIYDTIQNVTTRSEDISTPQYRYQQNTLNAKMVLVGTEINLPLLDEYETLLQPYNVYVKAQPTWRLLRIERVTADRPRPVFYSYDAARRAAGDGVSFSTVGVVVSGFIMYFTVDGVSVVGTGSILQQEAKPQITSSRNYGRFTEIDIEYRRPPAIEE